MQRLFKTIPLQVKHSGLSVGLAGLALSVMLSACNGNGMLGANPNAKVATVDENVITRAEYDKTYKLLSKSMNVDINAVSDPNQKQMITQAVNQMVMQKLILDALIENEAKTLNLTVSDTDVEQFKSKMLSQNPTAKEEFKKYLDENMMSERDFDQMLKQNLLTEKLIERKVGDKIQVNDTEVTSFFKSHPEQFNTPEQIRASHILVKAIAPQMARDIKAGSPSKPEAEIQKEVMTKKEELRAKAEKIYTDISQNPKKFEALAKSESNDPGSASNGGDLNYVVQRNIDPNFWSALKATKPGQLHNGVVETQFGYHVIKVVDIKPPKKNTLAEMKPSIANYISAQKKQQQLMTWAAERRATAKINIEPAYEPKQPQQAGPASSPGGGVSLGNGAAGSGSSAASNMNVTGEAASSTH